MPVILAALIGGLVSAAGSFVGRAMIAIGVGIVVYQGVDVALETFKTMIFTNLAALPGGVLGMINTMKIGVGLNIIFSALAARLVLNGLTGGAIKRFVLK